MYCRSWVGLGTSAHKWSQHYQKHLKISSTADLRISGKQILVVLPGQPATLFKLTKLPLNQGCSTVLFKGFHTKRPIISQSPFCFSHERKIIDHFHCFRPFKT